MNTFIHTLLRQLRGSTMIELMAVLAIMGMGIAGLLETIGSGIYFAKDTEDNIKAINLAREWIEWVINIRDTNWLRFSGDRVNCWRTQDYNGGCINDPSFVSLISSGSYTLYTRNGAWLLSWATQIDPVANWNGYASMYRVGLDSEGFFTQTGVVTTQTCSNQTQTGCLSIFAREINLIVTNSGSMNVSSIVRWQERRYRSVILNTTLTNWKSNF